MGGIVDPISVYRDLRGNYLRYLGTRFYCKDPNLREEFEGCLEKPGREDGGPPIVRPPILQVSPEYDTGARLDDLVSQGVLCRDFERVRTGVLPPLLYQHQEEGIRKAIVEGRNLVVATGTGSGKTEIFLIPILNHLLREAEQGTLEQPGPRALLLYPMNALANDQMGRLRKLLAAFPDITFGRYTGETRPRRNEALALFRSRYGTEPLPNELVSREEMQANPPHILLTNYAMLEYLMIRPMDAPLFQGGQWRFIVLDEVHTYSGVKGAEIAMLLRRFKDRVGVRGQGHMQCFATSATLGEGTKDHPAIARFATRLFDELFAAEDVIAPSFRPPEQFSAIWGAGSAEGYRALSRELDARLDTLAEVAADHFPENIVREALQVAQQASSDKSARRVFLGALLENDQRLRELRERLSKTGLLELSGGRDDNADVLLVGLAARALAPGSGRPLIGARYHILARALDGAWVWFDATGRPHLSGRRERRHQDKDGASMAVFELGVCKRCGEPFLVGVNRGGVLVQPSEGHEPEELSWFALRPAAELESVDEDDVVEGEALGEKAPAGPGSGTPPFEEWAICRRCGALRGASEPPHECQSHAFDGIEVLKIPRRDFRHPRRCPSCGNFFAGTATRVMTGRENPVAVLATTLYKHIPPAEDPRQSGFPGDGRKLIIFSDSRQDAAFFAPFMDRSYGLLRRRRYLAKALERTDSPVDLDDWVSRTRRQAEHAGEWSEECSDSTRRRDAARWVIREFAAWDRRQSLEGTGVVQFLLRRPRAFSGLELLSEPPWRLDTDEQWSLLTALFDTLRRRQAVSLETGGGSFDGIDWDHEVFRPLTHGCFVRAADSSSKHGVLAWAPAQNRSNSRLDLLRRLLMKRGEQRERAIDEAHRALQEIWRLVEHPNGSLALLCERGLTHKHETNLYRLKPEMWQVQWLGARRHAFRCNVCGTVARSTPLGICPLYGCPGEMQPYPLDERQKNHFFHLFTEVDPVPMSIEEHTAQLENNKAYEVQHKFIEGQINVLSCTTTFELGVDLGDLEAVLMHNVPPSPSNYIQRAGRAGRRRGSAALIVTYAQHRSHDFAYFTRWPALVGGTVRPPALHIANSKIVRRHVHAEALAAFFRRRPETFKDRVDAIFDPEADMTEAIRTFLRSRPDELRERLERVVPNELHEAIGLEDWSWLEGKSEDGSFVQRLERAQEDIRTDWNQLRTAEDQAGQQKHYGRAAVYQKQLKTLRSRSLLGRLGTYGLMPKYGFPTEVVELKIRSERKEALALELDRDLRLAVSEYAPMNQVVAGGKVWTSRGIVIPIGRRLHEFWYWHCSTCGYFDTRDVVATNEEKPAPRRCYCGKKIDAYRYLYPEFGFTTALGDGAPVGEARPPYRSYARSFFQSVSASSQFKPVAGLPRVESALGRDNWIHVINEGMAKGFFICDRCGYAQDQNPAWSHRKQAGHVKPWTKSDSCKGTLRNRALGHRYRTDTLELRVPAAVFAAGADGDALWLSVLYAILKGASRALAINERDIDGCLHHRGVGAPSLVLFDTSPGGAGIVREIANHVRVVFEEAANVANCAACGPDSSCISCLRTYANQRYHEQLRRGLALQHLRYVLKE